MFIWTHFCIYLNQLVRNISFVYFVFRLYDFEYSVFNPTQPPFYDSFLISCLSG